MMKNRRQQSYWSLVRRQFKRNRLAMAGLWIVLVLFLVAILAPFIANNKPLVMRYGGTYTFPLFRSLKSHDLILLTVLGAVFTWHGVRFFLMRLDSLVWDRLRIPITISLIAVAAVSSALLLLHPYRIDVTDYKTLAEHRAPEDIIVFPPIRFTPTEYDLGSQLEGPSYTHWFGTDATGRDILSRMVYGSRVSLSVGFVAVSIYVAIGIVLGAMAGYFGGWVDILISRLIEIMLCFPTFFLIITIIGLLEPSIFNIMVVIGITGWTGVARLIRGEVLKVRAHDFVRAGMALGASPPRILLRHILPNAIAPALVSATFGVASAILIESSLSFLGFGIQPPDPSWGGILSQSKDYIDFAWWLATFPGLAIFMTITAYNLVGEGLRDAIDPR